MASRAGQKQEAREARLALQDERAREDHRRTLVRRLLIVVGVAVLVLVTAVIASTSGGRPELDAAARQTTRSLASIPQSGGVLGPSDAPVRIVEFGDLQCPVCAAFAERELPQVIDQHVRTGEASLEFRNWAFLGPDSTTAAAAFLAAAEQRRAWQFTELFYGQQGVENSGYVTDGFLSDVATAAGLDVERFDRDRRGLQTRAAELAATYERQATDLGLTGTPGVVVVGLRGRRVVQDNSAQAISEAVAAVR